MKSGFIAVICLVWVGLFSGSALGADPWGPFENPPEPIPLVEVECLEGEEWHRTLRTFVFTNDHEEVRLVFVPGAETWSLSLKRNDRQYMSHPYTGRDDSMGVWKVHAKDLNDDNVTDFVVELVNGGFNGLNSGLRQFLIIFPRNAGPPMVHSCWTWDFVTKGLVDMDGDGCPEIILTELIQPGYFSELGDYDHYWVYDRYELNGMAFTPVRGNGWPVWEWFAKFDYLEKHRPETKLAREQKDALWTDYSGYSTDIKTTELKLDEGRVWPDSWSPIVEADLRPGGPKLAAPNPEGIYDHVVYSGETLENIARQYGADTNVIMERNGITNPAAVKPGVRLLVPIPD